MSGTNTGIVTFDPVGFLARYPEFNSTPYPTLQAYFNEAAMAGYLDNSVCSPVGDASPGGQRAILLNMLTAHVAFLAKRGADAVGAIGSAGEGSVSTSFVIRASTNETDDWLKQTQYGRAFLAASKPFRRAFYVPPMPCGPLGYGAGPGGVCGWPGYGYGYPGSGTC